MQKKKYYLAYGSNLNVTQMEWRCPRAKIAGYGTLQDWQLLFRGSGTGAYLTIEPCEEFLYIQSNGANHYIPYGAIADILF